MDGSACSVFRPAAARTLDLIAEHNQEHRCNFLLGSNFINPAAAKLSYLLSDLVGAGSPQPHFSYLVSSGLEALSGAINLARHTAVRAGRDDGGWVLLVDADGRFHEFMDPVRLGSTEALMPHVVTVPTVSRALYEIDRRRWAALIIVRDEHLELQDRKLTELVQTCRRSGGQVGLCCTELELASPALFDNSIGADVMIFGEGLADRQLPFGAFTMSTAANQVWRNQVDCFAHTSTFGGNVLCASLVLDTLDKHGYVTDRHHEVLRAIDADPGVTIDFWGRHIKPDIAALARVFGLHVEVQKAAGGRFTTAAGSDVIDCAGGLGSNLRGHNPPDLVPGVLAQHDPGYDYFTDLERKLIKLTGLDHAFPAVSGAIANDIAVTLGALANPQRRTVVTFKGNFGGKTMFSLNLSRNAPQQTESDADAFRPYYANLVYIDPFAPDAAEQLSTLLRGGDVALVWFELVQGAMCRRLPDDLVQAIDRHRAEHGYLVGVDEILTGGWRSGEQYLAHRGVLECADIVTLGKTLSDMTVPAAAVLVSKDVYAQAKATSPTLVARLHTEFRHNLSAHIALHALESVDDPDQRARHQAGYAELVASLNAAFRRSRVFGDVAGSSAHLRLTVKKRYLRGAKLGALLEMTLSDLVYRRCRVFLPALRIMHRIAADPADLNELARRLEVGTKGITPLMVYRYAFGSTFAPTRPRLSRLLKGRAATPQV
ncbi:MAG TPA: aminotransferase class III-fold pyridoxal phosphate-dependent enzyme [Pseudonocardiaceae bacterium]|nr:aminotransferase class III-fold pyridoxal phosphate-dependent enzyme [Pseudonocardiaceae bacterium]